MSRTHDILSELTRADKAELLHQLIDELGQYPSIESRPDVCGGEPCIVRTRIPVWTLEQARRLKLSEAEILQAYPTLRAADLANAWNYVRDHANEISRQIDNNEHA